MIGNMSQLTNPAAPSIAGVTTQPAPSPAPQLNEFGINTKSKTYAAQTFAALTRDQWQTYLNTFVPLENKLIQYAMDPGTVSSAVASARQDVAQSFDAQEGVQQRRLRSFGLEMSSEEQAAATRQTGLSKALADVNAANQTATRVKDRQSSLLGNPAPSLGTGG